MANPPDIGLKISVKVPNKLLDEEEVRKAIKRILISKTTPEVKALFRGTTFGWSNKPRWRNRTTESAKQIAAHIWLDPNGPNADKYRMVSMGVEPHNIPPRTPGGLLHYQKSYKPSTSPGSLLSRRNYKFGPWVTRRGIGGRFSGKFHPGLEARLFPEQIAKEYFPTFRRDINKTIDEAKRYTRIIYSIIDLAS